MHVHVHRARNIRTGALIHTCTLYGKLVVKLWTPNCMGFVSAMQNYRRSEEVLLVIFLVKAATTSISMSNLSGEVCIISTQNCSLTNFTP